MAISSSILLALTALAFPGDLAAHAPSPAQAHEVSSAWDPPVQGAWAFTNVTVIPMDRERVLTDHTVVIRDGMIVAVGPSTSTPVPDDATAIPGHGRYLLPGLAEMHAHVPPGQDPSRDDVEETLFLYLAGGVTTIRGMLGAPYQLELREELRRGEVLGPHFYVGAPSVNGNTAPTPEAADSLVRAHQAAGYDFLKIHPGVPLDAWDQMVETAREVGITFAGHVPSEVGIHHAIRTGMATVDHLDGFLQATRIAGLEFDDPVGLYSATDPDRLDALTRELAERDVWLVPTQYLWNLLNGYVDPDSLLARPEFRYISPGQRDNYRSRADNNRSNPNITPESHEAHAEMRQDFLAAAHRSGAPILMGTDSPQLFMVPGFAIHRELPLMVDAGMTPYEVLVTGTREVARYVEESLGQPGNFGTVTVGNRADLVLVEANPLERVEALQEMAGVMVDGRWLDSDAVSARLAEIAARHAGAN